MKKTKYTHCIYGLLLLGMSASCSEDYMASSNSDYSAYTITGGIADVVTVSPRMLDEKDSKQTVFEKNDEIHIGWSGNTATYKYVYTGSNQVFAAADTEADKGLWAALIQQSTSPMGVYAWHGALATTDNSLPVAGTTVVSVSADQTTETKYLQNLYLAAHQQFSPSATNLNFSFRHLVSRLKIHFIVADSKITQSDIMNSQAELEGISLSGTLAEDVTSKDWKLEAATGTSSTPSLGMLKSWTSEHPMEVDYRCLLIPQTLTTDTKIIITLENGRIFTCALQSGITLSQGEEITLNIKLKSGDGYEVTPQVTVLEKAYLSSYSGNRIFSAVNVDESGTTRSRLYIYDKQVDGTWGTPSVVYDTDEEGSSLFPDGQTLSNIKTRSVANIDLYGNYGVVSYYLKTNGSRENCTYFIKKSKTTGRWYCAAGPLAPSGYAVAINNNFLVSGDNTDVQDNLHIYYINEDGEIKNTNGQRFSNIYGFKLCLADNNILAAYSNAYQLSVDNEGQISAKEIYQYNAKRVATDGKRIIMQDEIKKDITIYNIETNQIETVPTGLKGGVGRPVAIYDKYALVGQVFNNEADRGIKILYYTNQNEWKEAGDGTNQSFLHLIQEYEGKLTEIDNTSGFNGNSVFLKGPYALIPSDVTINGTKYTNTYFIENIDKLVDKWLAETNNSETL